MSNGPDPPVTASDRLDAIDEADNVPPPQQPIVISNARRAAEQARRSRRSQVITPPPLVGNPPLQGTASGFSAGRGTVAAEAGDPTVEATNGDSPDTRPLLLVEKEMLERLMGELSAILKPQDGADPRLAGEDPEEIAQATGALETAEAQSRTPKPSRKVLSWCMGQIPAFLLGMLSNEATLGLQHFLTLL